VLKFIIGLFLGVVFAFLICGIRLIIIDEKRIQELKEKVKER